MLCSDDQPRRADIRYNLSIDDRHVFSAVPCKAPGAIGSFDGIRFYNNTVVAEKLGTSIEAFPLPWLYNAGDFEFRNNILFATQPRRAVFACGHACSDNLFSNVTAEGHDAIVADPLFVDATLRGTGRLRVGAGFRLQSNSPARGQGLLVPGAPTQDYFGHPVPATGRPAIGFHQPAP